MSFDDTNFVVYGHNVYYDHASFFAPLTTFEDQSIYEANKTLKLYTDAFVRSYEIVSVYEVNRTEYETAEYQEKYTYQKQIFADKADYDAWSGYAAEKNAVTPDQTIAYGDDTMTLQVCKPYHSDTRIIVVCKEVGEYFWGNSASISTACDVETGC